jgi:hypothetical protein
VARRHQHAALPASQPAVITYVPPFTFTSTKPPLPPLSSAPSRCTGYRPILDAFKTFTKVDLAAYTEEAIAAARGIPLDQVVRSSSKAGGKLCPSTGQPCDCGAAGGGHALLHEELWVGGDGGCRLAARAHRLYVLCSLLVHLWGCCAWG